MANYIEDSKIEARRFVPFSSRYSESKVNYYVINDKRKITFETYKKNIIKPKNKDSYLILTPKYEYRPDLLSLDAYGIVDYWWKIMEANNIKDIFEFKAGLNIRIPSGVL